MRRFVLLMVLLVLPLAAGTMTRTARFDRGDLLITPDNGYDNLELRGGAALIRPGAPRVPYLVQSVVVPAGAVPTRVQVVVEEWTTLPGTYSVGPAQPDFPLPSAGKTATPTLWPQDPAIYGSASPYPATLARLAGSGTMSGYSIAQVELCPVRYLPATGQVQLATRVSYRLEYAEGSSDRVSSAKRQAIFGDMLRAFAANPGDVDRFAPRVCRAGASWTLPAGYYEYVAITEAPLDTVFQRLADWKTLKGVPGTVVRISWISANYPGYDLQEKIRNFIIDAETTWGAIWVLLGGSGDYNNGGQNIFPTRMCQYQGNGPEPCDLYYAGLDGNWDRNGNHTYGEIPDSADMYSDVFVGRASVYTVAMAQNFVSKTMKYEQSPPRGFIQRMLLPTAILWSSYEERPMVESIARQCGPTFQIGRLYERAGTLSHQACVDSLNDGWGMSHWDGHGSADGIYMGSTPFFSSSDAQAMTNGDMTGIAVAISCYCAAWDEVPGGDCVAEHMVNRVGGGFIATVMNTRYGYGAIGPGGNYVPGPSERLDTTLYAGVLLYGMPSAGQALAYSKATWAPYADSLYQYAQQRFCIYDLTLIGDPETPLWTSEPDSVVVTHNGVINIGNNIPYTVTVTTRTDAPIESALVIMRKGDEVNVRGRTNSSGQVTLLVSALTPGPITMNVNARDHYLVVDTVMAISTGRYVSYLRSSISDPPPGGNGDGIVNPGETFTIPTWVKNYGPLQANSVTGRLRTHTAGVTITDSLKSFGNVAGGDSALTSPGFGMSVATGLPNGYAIPCSLVCKDANDTTWVSYVTFRVGAPSIAYASHAVKDSMNPRPNGKLDPGEQADLEVTVRNSGLGNAYNVRVVLRSGDARLTVPDSVALYGTVLHDSSSTNRADHFTVYASNQIPLETPIPCTLDFYADAGYVGHANFSIVVGEIRTIDPVPDNSQPYEYWAYDDDDTGYVEHPTFSWIELRGQGTRLTLSDDQTVTISIPSGFGPFVYYDQSYTQLSICSNGWIAPGSTTISAYTNTSLPASNLPSAALCINWDDIYPPSGGGVWYYHDAANHRFVVEWDSVRYYSGSAYDKYEIVLYDTTLAADDGNCVFAFQYLTANQAGTSATVGIQQASIFIQDLLNGGYTRGCAPWEPGHAIKFTTDDPVGIAEPEAGAFLLRGRLLAAAPTVFRRFTNILWQSGGDGAVDLRVFDASGRVVRTLACGTVKAGRYVTVWNGADDAGGRVSSGVYFVKLVTPDKTAATKLVVR